MSRRNLRLNNRTIYKFYVTFYGKIVKICYIQLIYYILRSVGLTNGPLRHVDDNIENFAVVEHCQPQKRRNTRCTRTNLLAWVGTAHSVTINYIITELYTKKFTKTLQSTQTT